MRHPLSFLRVAAVLVLGVAVAGCSYFDWMNPFANPKPKMAPLPDASNGLAQGSLVWKVEVGETAPGFIFYPALVGDAVYAAGSEGKLVKIENGQVTWKIDTGKTLSAGVGSDGRIVVVATSEGEVLAYSAYDGSALWQAKVSSEVLAPPLVSAGVVAIKSVDNRIVAFDEQGAQKWLFQRPTPPLALRGASPMLSPDPQFILTGFPGGRLIAISMENGAPVWEGVVAQPRGVTELDRISDVLAPPVFNQTTGCAVAYQGKVACFDFSHNGDTVWSRPVSSSAGLGVDNRQVYVTDEQSAVIAYSGSSGANVWKNEQLLRRSLTAPQPVPGLPLIALGDAEGYLHFLSRDDGAYAGRFSADGTPIQGTLTPAGDHRLLLQSRGGKVMEVEVK
ncbi:MAG: outer membrane protein assembly factor BamB [Zoogloeaceae bacterium]|jgi:outer membrane protein assembly factor BamB|nr:outer membrane protein assembly factor BamB [Zoogloeaceae bacterium]